MDAVLDVGDLGAHMLGPGLALAFAHRDPIGEGGDALAAFGERRLHAVFGFGGAFGQPFVNSLPDRAQFGDQLRGGGVGLGGCFIGGGAHLIQAGADVGGGFT